VSGAGGQGWARGDFPGQTVLRDKEACLLALGCSHECRNEGVPTVFGAWLAHSVTEVSVEGRNRNVYHCTAQNWRGSENEDHQIQEKGFLPSTCSQIWLIGLIH